MLPLPVPIVREHMIGTGGGRACQFATSNRTSIFPRVAFEYGQT